jgi:flagellar biosynthesis/type III secretory pathway M-ring protein FliF/YscJ
VKRAEALSAAHENQAADQRAYEAAVANRQQTRTWSLWSALLALGVFVLLGLILAVLAIERHTRMLEQIRQAG